MESECQDKKNIKFIYNQTEYSTKIEDKNLNLESFNEICKNQFNISGNFNLLHDGSILENNEIENLNENDEIYCLDDDIIDNIQSNIPNISENDNMEEMMNFMNGDGNLQSVMDIMQNKNMQKMLSNKNLIQQMIEVQNNLSKGNIQDISSVENLMKTPEIQGLVTDSSLMNQMYSINKKIDPNFNSMPDIKMPFMNSNESQKNNTTTVEEKSVEKNVDEKKYSKELAKLKSMGLKDINKNIELLKKYKGNIKKVMYSVLKKADII